MEWYAQIDLSDTVLKQQIMGAMVNGFSGEPSLITWQGRDFRDFFLHVDHYLANPHRPYLDLNLAGQTLDLWQIIMPDIIERFVTTRDQLIPEFIKAATNKAKHKLSYSPLALDVMFPNMFFRAKLLLALEGEQLRDVSFNDAFDFFDQDDPQGAQRTREIVKLIDQSNLQIDEMQVNFPAPNGGWHEVMMYDPEKGDD